MVDKLGAAVALAGAANCVSDGVVAVKLLGAAQALRQAIGAPIPPVDGAEYDAWRKGVSAKLTTAQVTAALLDGAVLSYEQAIRLALEHG